MDSYSLPLLEEPHSLRRAGLFAVPAKAQLAPEGLAPWRRVERCRRVSETVGESLLTGPLREGWCGRPACHRRRVERRPHVFGKILRIPLDGITQMTPRHLALRSRKKPFSSENGGEPSKPAKLPSSAIALAAR